MSMSDEITQRCNKRRDFLAEMHAYMYKITSTSLLNITNDVLVNDIYALAFLVEENSDGEDPYWHSPRLEFSYNTNTHVNDEISKIKEKEVDERWTYDDCVSERKWNYAYWPQTSLAEMHPTEGAYKQFVDQIFPPNVTVTPFMESQESSNYEEIWREFHAIAVMVVMDLHRNGMIKKVFGRSVPIFIHGYEYTNEEMYMTAAANPEETTDDWMAFNFYDPSKNIKK